MNVPIIATADGLIDSGCRPPTSGAPWSLYGPRQRWTFLLVLFMVTTSNYFDYNVLSVVLEPIKEEFQVSDTMLGLLSGFFFALLYALAGLPIARWADRGNRRTVITLALVGWSVMTTLCGLAQSFWQLAFARFGLGATESGALPPAQSLIADYFPPQQRGISSAVLNAGTAAGYFVGVVIGGSIAAAYGWRMAFILAGALGLVLAVIVRWVLPEPRTQYGFPSERAHAENIGQAFAQLRRKRTFVHALVALAVYMIFACGFQAFLPAYMLRTLHVTLSQVSVTWGLAISAANMIGALLGGWLGDRLSRSDIRWHGWLPAIGCALAAPVYWSTLAATQFSSFVALDFAAECIVSIGTSVCFVPILLVCGSQRRTTAMAVAQLSFMLIGGGIGPFLAGALSDVLSVVHGVDGLRYSLAVMIVFLIPAAFVFYRTGCSLPGDLEA